MMTWGGTFLGVNFDIFEPEVVREYWENLNVGVMKPTDRS